MQTSDKILLASLGTVLAFAVTKGYEYYKKLKYRLSKVTISSIQSNGVANMTLFMRIYNPSAVTITVNKIAGTVYLNNRKVGTIAATFNQDLTANAISTVEIPVTVGLLNTGVNILFSLIAGNDYSNWPLKVDATITVANVPVDITFEYKLSELLYNESN